MTQHTDPTDWEALPDETFRARLREWIEAKLPAELRHLNRRASWIETRPWYMALSRAGLIAPGWPKQYGGLGLSPGKHLLMIEELERAGTPWMYDAGIRNVGPVLIAHGTEAQRAAFMPKMLSGEHVWCQGYSEPGAGSDLASLQTRGKVVGEELVLNGHKIWTTIASEATHMFALVRTGEESRKHDGITFVVLEMAQLGIRVSPILNLAGHTEFFEVFLEDARTPLSNVIGGLGNGWKVAKAQLGFERIWAGSPKRAIRALRRLEQVAELTGAMRDPAFRDRLTQLRLDVLDTQSLYERCADLVRHDGKVSEEISALKIWATEVFQRVSEAIVEAAGDFGGFAGEVAIGEDTEVDVLSTLYESRGPTIFAGANEVHRNILAKRVLGLPEAA